MKTLKEIADEIRDRPWQAPYFVTGRHDIPMLRQAGYKEEELQDHIKFTKEGSPNIYVVK